MSLLPSKTHISYKEKERNLLVYEEELMDHYSMNRSDLHKHLIRNAYTMLKMPQVGFYEKMDKPVREQHEQKINYLIAKRQEIEDASGFRIDPDLKLAYAWISDEIRNLKQNIFEQHYLRYEQRLNDVLNIGRNSK